MKKDFYLHKKLGCQHGVVLIIALILLVVISLLAVSTLHNASSTESIAGNVRTTELATQAADIALRYCENDVLVKINNSTNPYVAGTGDQWKVIATWDSETPTKIYTIPLTFLQLNGIGGTYKRPPECMVEQLLTKNMTSIFFLITARGFSPEVPALVSGTRIRPVGTEVWLQSQIEIEI